VLLVVFGGSCRKQYQQCDDYFLFGYEPVDCHAGDCVRAYLLRNGKLYEDALRRRDRRLNASRKPLQFHLQKESRSQCRLAAELRAALPVNYLANTGTTSFGETGNDLGYYYVELKTNETVQRWYFATYNDRLMPAELHDFVQKLANTFTELSAD